MEWEALLERERSRYEDGMARLVPEQLVRIGNAAYGAGLAALMLGRGEEAERWLDLAATRWRESWEHATPTSWGRPIGAIKAALLAGREAEAAGFAGWALELGSEQAESPIGRYAAALALLTLGRWDDAARVASSLRDRDDFPPAVADGLALIAAGDAPGYEAAVVSVLESFETRDEYLEDAAVADTVMVLQVLARKHGLSIELPASPVLPG